MRFIVAGQATIPSGGPYPFVVLTNDNWDDYGFKTLFRSSIHLARDRVVQLREVKILQRNQHSGRTQIPREFDSLDRNYCSLGQDLAYYESLRTLDEDTRGQYLKALRDAATDQAIRESFQNEEGFKTSLLRWGGAEHALDAALSILSGAGPGGEFSFTFHTRFGSNEFTTHFGFRKFDGVPGRINAIIGYNGAGKTQMLANLAQVAGADSFHRDTPEWVSKYGRITPSDLRFGKIVAISYSAFDTFAIPSSSKDMDSYGYVYCGLRRTGVRNSQSGLKPTAEIVSEMEAAIERIDTPDRRASLERALQPLRDEPSFARAGYALDVAANGSEWRDEFNSMSSGHKISMNILVQLVGALQQRSLVLIDEPESHLHPPLLAALMKGITSALESHDSYAVIATHSPIVLQDIASCYARVLSREGALNSVELPEIETFGENLGALTRHVFNLDNSRSDYVGVLRELAANHSLEEIESLFELGLSSQARALIMQAQRR